MKIRFGFVSNSSSCSFVVIRPEDICFPSLPEILIVDNSFGETQFGWQNNDYYDFGSKLIFAYLQTTNIDKHYNKDYDDENVENVGDVWLDMLERVVIENTNVKKIEWLIDTSYISPTSAYIDHQSSACEGQNIEMFESEEVLKNFLFGQNSMILTDNDNER